MKGLSELRRVRVPPGKMSGFSPSRIFSNPPPQGQSAIIGHKSRQTRQPAKDGIAGQIGPHDADGAGQHGKKKERFYEAREARWEGRHPENLTFRPEAGREIPG